MFLKLINRNRIIFCSLFLWLGCAHVSGPVVVKKTVAVESEEEVPTPRTLVEVLQEDVPPSTLAIHYQDGALVVQGIKLKHTRFDFPVTINSHVEYWIHYFCGRGRSYFSRYLERSEHFIPFLVPLLRKNGLPEDLVYLSMIESGFSTSARSHASAVGPWQFMPGTGKLYGLKINWWLDERREVERSTLAAIDYLRNLYLTFGSWELAAAAYNAGPGKVSRALNRFGTSDFWALIRHQFFRPETRAYVPKIMAAAIVAKNREQFGFLKPGTSIKEGEVIQVPETSTTSTEGLPLVALREEGVVGEGEPVVRVDEDAASEEEEETGGELNEVLSSAESSEEGSGLLMAEKTAAQTVSEENREKESIQQMSGLRLPYLLSEREVFSEEVEDIVLKSPADLLKIASATSLSYGVIKALNPGLLRWCTPPFYSRYRMKIPKSLKDRFLEIYHHPAFPREVRFLVHSAKAGETLSKVASHFGFRVDPLLDLNQNLSSKKMLTKGLKVVLPLPEDRSRSLASLGVKDPPPVRKARSRLIRNTRRLPLKIRKTPALLRQSKK